ncbi:DNA repair protein RadA [Caedibacter taeniospiralis]|uniref:DNA repair protein RadA n=1 Tax=Caedibacter taeniospiralis TaxID=28907 RepID=UPI000C27A11F|nr:DNA repair protein RadA [Caedibacter taeniospiralis]
MAKAKTNYVCQSCGAVSPKWQGQCSDCLEWNTLIETQLNLIKSQSTKVGYAAVEAKVQRLNEVSLAEYPRIHSPFDEFDRVMGGGIVPGSVTLIGGDPGIGKSSILLQIMTVLSLKYSALYITGEESLEQVALRARRMQLPNEHLLLMSETNVGAICRYIETHRPQLVVVDSIQTMQIEDLQSAPGGVAQVRESASLLTQTAKHLNCAVFLVGHVTKSGEVAGPRVLEHIVDSVVFIEGQTDGRYRMVRAMKNRFGAVNELGVFAMTDKGMREIKNPSAIFLNRAEDDISGSVIIAIWEGTRPILVEVQALVSENGYGQPRRLALGLDPNRVSMLLAIMQRHLSVQLGNYDVFINIVGGIKVNETSIDLAIIAVILSSLYNRPIAKDWIIVGEVGLSGEIRPVPYGQERLLEAQKHGFKQAIVPYSNLPKKDIGMKVHAIKKLNELKEMIAH